MFSTGDTIVAVATPPGRGSIGVVRLSGPEARSVAEGLIARTLEPRHATVAHLDAPAGARDQVVATWFVGPHSYTGEDVVEISTHGNPLLLDQVVARSLALGARHAMPGEFTFRAYTNGRIDLVQAESVADLIEAVTPTQLRAACDQLDGTLSRAIAAIEASLFGVMARLEASLDFPDEGYHFIAPGAVADELGQVEAGIAALVDRAEAGRVLREGARVVILGQPNVGKSSVFNALVGTDRAIVCATPGTTRDTVTAAFDAAGVPCEAVDTAGHRDAVDEVEREGIERAKRAATTADVCLVVIDGSVRPGPDDVAILATTAATRQVVLVNKQDQGVLDEVSQWTRSLTVPVVAASALTGEGVDRLRVVIGEALGMDADTREMPRVTNRRHAATLERARSCVRAAVEAARGGATEEFVLVDVREALAHLQSVTGQRAQDAVLTEIFARFCIGK